jgi:hypothetical protein
VRLAAAALVVFAASLALATPAGAVSRRALQEGAFSVSAPTAPIRDVVITHPTPSEARDLATASAAQSYPVNDGAGRTVQIQVSALCTAFCSDADPQTIANFLGTLPHGDEISLLTVEVVEPNLEMPADCGAVEAQACYYPDENRMFISGDDTTSPPPDNATREFVISHEYGHHLANHRNNSPFNNPAIDWGPKNWASFAQVCQGVRAGRYFPGDEGDHYRQNPGEAFAESFAHNRFPTDPVPWEWPDFPDPHTGAFPAIQRDALHPWNGDSKQTRHGRFGKRRRRKRDVERFATPLDGDMTLTLKGPDRANLALKLKSADGHTVARANGPGSHEQVSHTICGERELIGVVRRHGHRKSHFKLTALIP